MADQFTDSECQVRNAWCEGDRVEIFSNSNQQWYSGSIMKVFEDDEGEWLECEYKRSKRDTVKTQIQRFSSDVRPERPEPSPVMDPDTIRRLMTDYENERANEDEKSEPECTLALIKPDSFHAGYAIIRLLLQNSFRVLERKQVLLTRTRAETLYAEHKGKDFFQELISYMTSGPMLALKLERVNAINTWLDMLGPSNFEKAKRESPSSIRARLGSSTIRNAAHGSESAEAAARELDFFFNCEQTLALIKPDVVADGKADEIVELIESVGFTVLDRAQITLSKERAEEFYTEHKGKDFFDELIAFMTSGELVALKLEKKNAIGAWRALMGAADSNVARKETPRSIRALYGSSTIKNATHGSVSIQTAARELAFFFPQQVTMAWIKPEAVFLRKHFEIRWRITDEGFELLRVGKQKYTEIFDHPRFEVQENCGGTSIALMLRATNAVAKLRTLMHWEELESDQESAPMSEPIKRDQNAYCSDSTATAKSDLDLLLPAMEAPSSTKQYTLALIKPDAVASGNTQDIIDRIIYEGFVIRDQLQFKLSKERAAEFYAEHKGRDFFGELIAFMASGEVVALKLEREGAIQKWLEVMGSSDIEVAKKESPQSVRALFATNAIRNATHGSDSEASAKRELDFFFAQ